MKILKNSVILLLSVSFLSACGNNSKNSIENIYDKQMYMEQDNEREYSVTFYEDGRADAAWYGREDTPESISYEIVDTVEVEGKEEPMELIQFDNFTNQTFDLSNSNDNQFLIDSDDNNLILRDYISNNEFDYILRKDYDQPQYPATEENDIFLIESE